MHHISEQIHARRHYERKHRQVKHRHEHSLEVPAGQTAENTTKVRRKMKERRQKAECTRRIKV
jgi:hypothetical protein